jgi:hypothetical protein
MFTFEPIADGTKVCIEFVLDSHGLPPGLLAPFGWVVAAKARDVISRDLADLKAATELPPIESAV